MVKMNPNKKSQNDSTTVSIGSQVGECENFWLVKGPPFDQRDYMVSPSETASEWEKSQHSTSEKRSKLRPCDIKIDGKYLLNSQKALRKLLELIKVGDCEQLNRLKNLIYKFLEGSPVGFLIEDLSSVIEVVEYFSRNRFSVPEFSGFVKTIMCYAKEPPKMGKTSDMLLYKEIIADYFTLFGELFASFDDECFQLQLLEALNSFLIKRKPDDISSVKLSLCQEALEESQLPCIIATLMETVSSNLYIHYVELALQMVLASLKSGSIMIQSNILDYVLRRLDLDLENGVKNDTGESYLGNENEKQIQDCYRLLDKSGYLIWGLFSVIPGIEIEIPCPRENALWSLRYVFIREARKITRKSIDTRNNLAAIIVKLCAVFGEKLPLVQSGLASVIARLAVATEINVEKTWLADIKFGTSLEDFILKKMMLLGCCLLPKSKNLLENLEWEKVIEGLLRIISSKGKSHWIPSQFATLFVIVLRTLSELVPEMPEVFAALQGNCRLLSTMKWLMAEHFDQPFLQEILKTLCVICTCENNKCIIKDMKANGGIKFLIDLSLYLLEINAMKLEHQEMLARVFVVLERLLMNDPKIQEKFAESFVKISLKLLDRILSDLKTDSKWNFKLLISFGGFFWEAVAWYNVPLKLFIEKGGIFLFLDFIEVSSYPIQILFLGILVDMTDEGETIAHLLTWRGKNGFGVLNMMIDIWRKEEYFTKVPRTPNGLILEVETPLMTEEQWFLTHQIREAHVYSPSIAEMVCSVRPKVHALYQFLERRYFSLTQIGESSYGLQLKMVKSPYRVYLPLIEHFLALKIGEVWSEVMRDANISGLIPTSFDGKTICTLIDEKNKWVTRIKTLQEEILLVEQGDDVADEKYFYKFLKSCRLSSTLEAMNELDYISRTSFRKFQKEKKEKQIQEIERSLAVLPFPVKVNVHRTYLFNTNVTCLCGDYIWLKSEKETAEKMEHISPVSSESSEDNRFEYQSEL